MIGIVKKVGSQINLGTATKGKIWILVQYLSRTGDLVQESYAAADFLQGSFPPSTTTLEATMTLRVPMGTVVYISPRFEADGTLIYNGTTNESLIMSCYAKPQRVVGELRYIEKIFAKDITFRIAGSKEYRSLIESPGQRFVDFMGLLSKYESGEDPVASVNSLWIDELSSRGADALDKMIIFLGDLAEELGDQTFDFNKTYKELTGDDSYDLRRFVPVSRLLMKGTPSNPGPFYNVLTGGVYEATVREKMVGTLYWQIRQLLHGIDTSTALSNRWVERNYQALSYNSLPSLNFGF